MHLVTFRGVYNAFKPQMDILFQLVSVMVFLILKWNPLAMRIYIHISTFIFTSVLSWDPQTLDDEFLAEDLDLIEDGHWCSFVSP
jgi:hypothetical protein